MNIFARRKTRFQYILPGDHSPGEKPDSSILSLANNHIYSPGRIAGFQYILPGEYSPGEKRDSSIFSRANIRPAKKTDSSIFSRAIIHQAKNQIPVYSPGRIFARRKTRFQHILQGEFSRAKNQIPLKKAASDLIMWF